MGVQEKEKEYRQKAVLETISMKQYHFTPKLLQSNSGFLM